MKNISKFKFWFWVGLLVVLFSLCYWQALREYGLTLVILLIVGLAFKEARETWTKGRGVQDDLFLTVAAIFITILTFVLQNLQSMQDINNALQSTAEYNCAVAKELKEEIVKTRELTSVPPRIKRRYTTELFKANMGYLLSKFNKKESQVIFETIGSMDQSNRFLDLSLVNFSELPRNLLSSNEKNNLLVSFDAYANVGKVYDNEILKLSQDVFSGLKRIDSTLGGRIDECNIAVPGTSNTN